MYDNVYNNCRKNPHRHLLYGNYDFLCKLLGMRNYKKINDLIESRDKIFNKNKNCGNNYKK